MDFPWKQMTAAAVATAYVATSTLKQEWAPFTFLGCFASSWTLGLACWAVWAVILYPKVFSPLIGLPEPKNLSWVNGQYSRIQALPTGAPQLEW